MLSVRRNEEIVAVTGEKCGNTCLTTLNIQGKCSPNSLEIAETAVEP